MTLVSFHKSCELAYRDATSNKIWGAALVRNPKTGLYHYVAAWGKPTGKLQSITRPVGSKWKAEKEYELQRDKKIGEGYWPEVSQHLRDILIAHAGKIQTSQEPIAAPKPKASIFDTGVFVAPAQTDSAPVAKCGYCALWSDQPAQIGAFWNAICTICKEPARLHESGHPHNRTSEHYSPPACGQFSLTPQQWADYGWNVVFGLQKPTVASVTPSAPLASGQADKCLLCFGIYHGFFGSQKHAAFCATSCTSCGATIAQHKRAHPHDMSMADCKQATFTDEAYAILGVTPGMFDLSKAASHEQTCPTCAVHMQSGAEADELAAALYAMRCEKCSRRIGEHVYEHPHSLFNSCSETLHPLKAYIHTGTLPTPLIDVLKDEAPEILPAPALKLLDLPCNCEHLLSLHHGPLVCLVATCKCEAYRRTCAECGETTRMTLRHTSSCMTGLRERLSAEPTQPPVRSDFKAPRKLTLADDF